VTTFLVTGGAGFIGSHLCDRLLAEGSRVVAVDDLSTGHVGYLAKARAYGQRFTFYSVDIGAEGLGALFVRYQPEVVYHLAACRLKPPEAVTEARTGVVGLLAVLQASVASGARKVVFASSSSVYGAAERYPTPEDTPPNPLSPYGISKLACEHLADAYRRQFGLDCVVVRYFNAFGPRQRPDMAFTRIVNALASGGSFELFGDGAQSRSWTYVSDVVEGTLAAFGGTGTYNVGGALEASMNESIALFERVSGRTLDVRRHDDAVPGDQRRTSADTTRIRGE